METLFILLSLVCLAVCVVSGILFAVKKICKKATRSGVVALVSLCVFVVSALLFIGLSSDWSDTLIVLSLLAAFSIPVLLVVILIRKIRKKKRLAHWICIAVAISVTIGSYHVSNVVWSREMLRPEKIEVTVETSYDFVVEDGDTPIEVVTSSGLDTNGKYRSVYDSCDAAPLLRTGVTEQDCLDALNGNPNISKRFKAYYADFTHRIVEKYPQADLSILYRNLSTLRTTELNRRNYLFKSLSPASSGVYRRDENAIYIPEGTVYKEGEWGFQVLIHEFCHAARSAWWKDDHNINFRFQFGTTDSVDRTILEEAMNSVFSCSLMNYYEKDIAYQLPSNYLRIMLECMDNYTLADYINHSDLYFLRKLDEYTGYTNYADVIWRLITLQRYDGQSDRIDIPAEEYNKIYDYLCEMYYGKYITPDMDDAQRRAVADELVEKAFYDVSEGYKINKDYFYAYLDSYVPAA